MSRSVPVYVQYFSYLMQKSQIGMGIYNLRKNICFILWLWTRAWIYKEKYILLALSFQFVIHQLCGGVFGWVCLLSFVANWFSNPSVVSFRCTSFLALIKTSYNKKWLSWCRPSVTNPHHLHLSNTSCRHLHLLCPTQEIFYSTHVTPTWWHLLIQLHVTTRRPENLSLF